MTDDLDIRMAQMIAEMSVLSEAGASLTLTEMVRQMPLAPSHPVGDDDTWLYIIQAGGRGGPVKIGVGRDPETRLAELQVGHHQDLKLLHAVSGTRKLEQQLHKELKPYRLRGEWFRVTPEVVAAVARVLLEPGRVSYRLRKKDEIYQKGCSNCGTPARLLPSGRCRACEEFAELRASGADPFEEVA